MNKFRTDVTSDSVAKGQTVFLDAGFTCARPGSRTLEDEGNGLFFRCDQGKHYISGQATLHAGRVVYLGLSYTPFDLS